MDDIPGNGYLFWLGGIALVLLVSAFLIDRWWQKRKQRLSDERVMRGESDPAEAEETFIVPTHKPWLDVAPLVLRVDVPTTFPISRPEATLLEFLQSNLESRENIACKREGSSLFFSSKPVRRDIVTMSLTDRFFTRPSDMVRMFIGRGMLLVEAGPDSWTVRCVQDFTLVWITTAAVGILLALLNGTALWLFVCLAPFLSIGAAQEGVRRLITTALRDLDASAANDSP